MTRGSTNFEGSILQRLRASKEVDGQLLSAAELARRVGTSKARILAYEAGNSKPEAARVRELASLFRVPPREFYTPGRGRYEQIKDMRCYAGLTAAAMAERLQVSRTTYRDVERLAILPARDDGTLPLRLAEVLGLPLTMIHRALDHHPVAAERRQAIAEQLGRLFARASIQYEPAVVDVHEEPLQEVARLLRRPTTVVCRLVNHELGQHRGMLKRLDVARIHRAYAQSTRQSDATLRDITGLNKLIEEHPFRAATRLVRFLAEAMSIHQWRYLVYLLEHDAIAWFPDEESDPEEGACIWDGLVARGFAIPPVYSAEGAWLYRLSLEGARTLQTQAPLYACLYPRAASPGRIQIRTRLSNLMRRTSTAADLRQRTGLSDRIVETTPQRTAPSAGQGTRRSTGLSTLPDLREGTSVEPVEPSYARTREPAQVAQQPVDPSRLAPIEGTS